MVDYPCSKCGKVFTQKSHYTNHLNNKYPCELKNKTLDTIVKEAVKEGAKAAKNSEDAESLDENQIDEISKKITQKELVLKKVDGTKVWELKNEVSLKDDNNEKAQKLWSEFNALIKACHQILYNSGAIVGKKAMDDIMKVLTLKLLQPQFTKGSKIWNKIKEVEAKFIKDDEKDDFDTYLGYCLNLKLLVKEDGILNEWKKLINNFLIKIIPNLYDEKDATFNCSELALKQMILKITEFKGFMNEDKNHVVHYDTISGQIYEYFMNEYIAGGGKELGQFFTPRKMINLIFFGLKIGDYVKIDETTLVYDCCCGSGGFLTRLFNCFKNKGLKPENIYGSEIEKDTMKFAVSNLLLTTDNFCSNIMNEDSIVSNNDKQYDIILTNPPFGTSMKYKNDKKGDGKKEEYEKLYKDNKTKFEDIYPIQTNDGACLFTQKCVKKLKNNGLCAIVLPDGQLFFGKNFRKFRKWLTETVNVRKIIQVPSGTFPNAGIKTCVVLFTKDGATKEVEFFRTDTDCLYLEKLVNVSSDELKLGEYSLDPSNYIEDTNSKNMQNNSLCEWIEIGKICILEKGKISSGKLILGTKYPAISISETNKYVDEHTLDNENVFIATISSGTSSGPYETKIKYYNGKCTYTNLLSRFVIDVKYKGKISYKYLYTYLQIITQGNTEARSARTLSEMIHIAMSLRRKLGMKGIALRSAAGLASSLSGTALPWRCTSQR